MKKKKEKTVYIIMVAWLSYRTTLKIFRCLNMTRHTDFVYIFVDYFQVYTINKICLDFKIY